MEILDEMHEVVTRLLNFWAQLLAGAEKAKAESSLFLVYNSFEAPVLPADDLAQLAMLLSMAGLSQVELSMFRGPRWRRRKAPSFTC